MDKKDTRALAQNHEARMMRMRLKDEDFVYKARMAQMDSES